MFTKPPPKLTYYEDFYGERNPDEDFDRFPDVCEDESSSSEECDKPKPIPKSNSLQSTPEGFFARFRTPKRKKRPGEAEDESASLRENKWKKGNGILNFIHQRSASPTVSKGKTGNQTAPSQIQNSLPVREKKKLTPRKGGLFASSFTAMDFDASTPDSAGEMMEDMFGAGAGYAVDFTNDFTMPCEDAFTRELKAAAYPSPRIDPALLLEDAARKDSARDQDIEVNGFAAGVRDGEEGDVEDNTSATSAKTKTKATRGRGRKKATATTISKTTPGSTSSPAKPAAAVANTKTKLQHPTPASTIPSRTSTRIAKTQPVATRSRAKTAGSAKAAKLQARNRNAMTARAAAMQNRAGARLTNKVRAKTALKGRAGGRSVRLRNWKGEVISDECVVVVDEDETDGEE